MVPARFCLLVAVATCAACGDARAPDPTAPEPSFAKGSDSPQPGDPTVGGVDPDSTLQGVTLDVEVTGSGFDHTAAVALGVNGEASRAIVTNGTTFLSETRLLANITVAPDADTVRYDVIVSPRRGGRGSARRCSRSSPGSRVAPTYRCRSRASKDGSALRPRPRCGA